MIGKFKQNLIAGLSLVAVTSLPGVAYASCENFLKDLETTSAGPSYKKDPETGQLKSLLFVGESSFLANKTSLVSKAKDKAFMKAKAKFTKFMKSNFSTSDLAKELTNQDQITDQNGNTAGVVEEMSTTLKSMQENASEVLSGIVALAECVDVEQKQVMVQAGWKPETARFAADAKQTIKKEVARGDAPVKADSGSFAAPSKAVGVKSSYHKSRMADDF